jgi:hypothetical protein
MISNVVTRATGYRPRFRRGVFAFSRRLLLAGVASVQGWLGRRCRRPWAGATFTIKALKRNKPRGCPSRPPRPVQLELLVLDESRPRGRERSADKELAALQRQHERVQRELNRQQTLVRLAQRTIGLAPPQAAADKPGAPGKGKRRRPVVRALRAAQQLHEQSQEAPTGTAGETGANTR